MAIEQKQESTKVKNEKIKQSIDPNATEVVKPQKGPQNELLGEFSGN